MTLDETTRGSTPTPDPDGNGTHAPSAVKSLKQAMRRARLENAERAGVVTDLRVAQLGRLELLQEALKPLIAQIPDSVDLFDIGLMPGTNPRLFIDMIGFVELGRDARIYHFFQDTRNGRVALAETTDVETMVQAVTDYVARRLLERDKALAADEPGRRDARAPSPTGREANRAVPSAAATDLTRERAPRSGWRWIGIAFAFVIDLLGSIAFFVIVAALVWVSWNKLHISL